MFGIFCAQMGFVPLYVFNLRVVFQEIHLNSRRFEDTHLVGLTLVLKVLIYNWILFFLAVLHSLKSFYIIRVKSLSRRTTQVGW